MPDKKQVVVVGAGFSGISAACHLASKGYEVVVLEKNESPGGRASKYTADGFVFDMGPSWYWMPDVFECFFQQFGHQVSDFYDLHRLDPGYRIFFDQHETTDIPADMDALKRLFESWETGSGARLDVFMKEAAYKYQVGIQELVYKPSRSLFEFADPKLLTGLIRMQLFSSMRSHVHRLFKHEKIRKILEFPVYFLGALPQNTPALYSLMNYADLKLGTWYPMGGMHKIIEGMVSVATSLGVKFLYHSEVTDICITNKRVTSVKAGDLIFPADIVVAGADYHHIEQKIIPSNYRQYSPKYWDKRVMAPSSLIFYLGVNKPIDGLLHHNLFFDESFEDFANDIYVKPEWPQKPLFYVCAPSKTDPSVAPAGMENIFILIPTAPNLHDEPQVREKLYHTVMERLEKRIGQSIRPHVIHHRSFAHRDFEQRYHAYKGNAYGLANTLFQTAIFKPSLKLKTLENWYFTGQLTVPGPGVPPSIISGEVVAKEILKEIPA